MTNSPEPEYEVRLNIRTLKKPLAYWQQHLNAIKAEIENHHSIRAVFSIGSYIGAEPFLLTPADRKASDKPGYHEKYEDAEAKIAAVVLKHDQS